MGARVTSNYFPVSGIVSLVSMTMEGQTLEVAAIGSDGVVGIETVLQAGIARWEAIASTPVEALRVSADRLRSELERSAALRRVLLQYSYGVLGQVAQAAVCHRFHTVAQRLARWLLVARERLRSDAIQMAQEAVAGLLGSPRTAVTTAAVVLQDRGAIRQRHGRTLIVDATILRALARECYETGKERAKPLG
jgi:CRP-like cAMP-binding protein